MDVIYVAAITPAVLFPLIYLRSRWTSTLPGRTAMVLSVVIAVSLIMGGVRQFTGQPLSEDVRITVFSLIALALWMQLIALLVVQYRREGRRIERQRADREVVEGRV